MAGLIQIFFKTQNLRKTIEQNPEIPKEIKQQLSQQLLSIETEISYLL